MIEIKIKNNLKDSLFVIYNLNDTNI